LKYIHFKKDFKKKRVKEEMPRLTQKYLTMIKEDINELTVNTFEPLLMTEFILLMFSIVKLYCNEQIALKRGKKGLAKFQEIINMKLNKLIEGNKIEDSTTN